MTVTDVEFLELEAYLEDSNMLNKEKINQILTQAKKKFKDATRPNTTDTN